ncbi:MAG: hypothetical protein WC852_00640 [Candidatus Nanoarchaeia archaeon]|jgi:uncharacterized protein Yka (UPF0111/DUF47 family)
MARRDESTEACFSRMCEESTQSTYESALHEMDEQLKEKYGISRLMFLNSTSNYADYIEEYESEKDRIHRQFYGMGY